MTRRSFGEELVKTTPLPPHLAPCPSHRPVLRVQERCLRSVVVVVLGVTGATYASVCVSRRARALAPWPFVSCLHGNGLCSHFLNVCCLDPFRVCPMFMALCLHVPRGFCWTVWPHAGVGTPDVPGVGLPFHARGCFFALSSVGLQWFLTELDTPIQSHSKRLYCSNVCPKAEKPQMQPWW